MKYDLQFLKDVLSVPTYSRNEGLMVQFITDFLKYRGYDYYLDNLLNIYVTKQTSENVDFFPCVVAHTDTVHNLDTIIVEEKEMRNSQGEKKLALKAINKLGKPTGIGGDDKCGVFACLTLLDQLPDLKAAFFVSEEIGCIGSKNADPKFFENVGYAIEFDAPENWMVTEFCFGETLFERNSDFFKTCDKVLNESFPEKVLQSHPYTDVYALRKKFDFACINFSIGYYNYHTQNEYVIVEDVFNGIDAGKKMIEDLGCSFHKQERKISLFSLFD